MVIKINKNLHYSYHHILKEVESLKSKFSSEEIFNNMHVFVYYNLVRRVGQSLKMINLYTNPYMHKTLGYTHKEIDGMENEYFSSIIHPSGIDNEQAAYDYLCKDYNKGRNYIYSMIYKCKNDKVLRAFGYASVYMHNENKDYKVIQYVAFCMLNGSNGKKRLQSALTNNGDALLLEKIKLLTPTEIKVIVFRVKGFTIKEIALKMVVSHRTIETHNKNIYVKLGVHNICELICFAQEAGLAT